MIANKLFFCVLGITGYLVVGIAAREAIIGGHIAEHDQVLSYQVSLQHDGLHICGGGIIHPQLILSAAHCFISMQNSFDNVSISVLAGTQDLNRTDAPAVRLDVTKIYVPKEFDPKTREGDIAIYKLSGCFKFKGNDDLLPVTLPKKRHIYYIHEWAHIAGWGWDSVTVLDSIRDTGVRYSSQLHYANAQVLDDEECLKDGTYYINLNKQICARVKQNRDELRGVCMFDNGGPLVRGTVVIGILSRTPHGCNEAVTPGTYTRVSNYLSFIQNVVMDHANFKIRVHDVPHP